MPTRSTLRKSTAVGPDAIALLIKDHRKVRSLLQSLDATTERATSRRESLLDEIRAEVKLHTQLEEEIFYPAYRDAARKSDGHLYYEALEEHHLVDIVLPKLKSTKAATAEFGARAKVLRDLIEHHAEEEETKMFPKARKAMGSARLRAIGKQIQERKQELQSPILTRAARLVGAAVGTVSNKAVRKPAA
jgi:hemerythrin-like domain-containing protein